MANNPTRIAYVDSKIQYGRGRAAQVLGQPCNVYRNRKGITNNSLMAKSPFYSNFPIRFRRITQKFAIEDQIFDMLCFVGLCDNLKLKLGDLIQETGYKADAANIYTFVQARPTRESLFIRCESCSFITRPYPTAGAAEQLPAVGPKVIPGWGGFQKATEQILVLVNGRYGFKSDPGGLPPAVVQVGIQQTTHLRDAHDPDFPTRAFRERFMLYIPPTPGEELNELDIINAGNGDRYQIGTILQTPDAGIAGWMVIGERMAV